jgi:hypothetical protein
MPRSIWNGGVSFAGVDVREAKVDQAAALVEVKAGLR